MSDRVRDLIASFEALPEPDKREAAVEILRRIPRSAGDLPADALDELPDEVFAALDVEEAARAGPCRPVTGGRCRSSISAWPPRSARV